ncbi:MAG TPA: DUF1573 domain-containing protein [Urbifossiella sp.]|jgi:hypothetical protein|nr:DUF1573 domain-containing protein [Urbifossiella sp.]
MRRALGLVAVAVGLAAPAGGQPPAQPQPPPPAGTPAPWANKFFLPDIGERRNQVAPPAVTHNFGEVPHGTLCTHTFTVTNIYDTPIQVVEVRKSCTCLDFVPLSKVLQPNESGPFTVTMNAGKFVGSNTQTFYVTFGPKFVSTAVVRVSAVSKTDVAVTPGAVGFGTLAPGAKAAQEVKVEYKGRMRDWKITEAVAPQGPFDIQVKETGRGGPLRGGAEYTVTVALKPNTPPGSLVDQVTLKTNDPANPVIALAVSGAVAVPLEVAPARVRFDPVAAGESVSQRVAIRSARSFRILGVDGEGNGVTVELPSTATPLPLQAITVKFDPTRLGRADRELRIRTDLDGGTAVTIPVEAEAR